MERMAAQRRIEVPRVTAAKRFGRYKREKNKVTRSSEVNGDEKIELMRRAWRRAWYKGHGTQERDFLICIEAIEGLRFDKGDIERFAIALTDHQDEQYFSSKAGYFLSALMMQHDGDDFMLSITHLQEGITGLGYRNSKNFTIDGNVPYGLGEGMEGGRIIVMGTCGDNLGVGMRGGLIVIERSIGWGCDGIANSMEGGEIIVKGNVEGDVGHNMAGGKITIMGDLVLDSRPYLDGSETVGNKMEGGEISIGGGVLKGGKPCAPRDMSWVGDVIHGRIYLKGKLIVDK